MKKLLFLLFLFSTNAFATYSPLALPPNACQETGGNLDSIDISMTKLPLSQGSTTASQSGPLVQGAVTTAAPSYTNAQTNPLSMTTSGALRIDGSGVNHPVVGNVASAATDSGNPIKIGGKYNSTAVILTNGQRSDAQVDSAGSLLVSERYAFRRQNTAAAAVVLKTGEGIIHTVCLNGPINGSSIQFWDNTAASGTVIAFLQPPNSSYIVCQTFDANFTTGLTFTTVGTSDWTITYR